MKTDAEENYMRKKILSFALAGMMIISLTACGNSENGSKKSADSEDKRQETTEKNGKDTDDEKTGGSGADADDEGANGSGADNDDKNNTGEQGNTGDASAFWVGKQAWSEPAENFEGSLFNEAVTLPVDFKQIEELVLEQIEDVDYQMPPDGFENVTDYIHSDRISDYFILEDEIRQGRDVAISVGYCEPDIMELIGIDKVKIHNYGKEALSLKECYENGWWFIESYDPSFLMLEYEEDETNYRENQLNALFTKFGTPSYIGVYFSKNNFYEALEKNDGSLEYTLIYEYPDYTLEVQMYEYISQEQSAYIRYVYYYPTSCWEQYIDNTSGYYLIEMGS